MPDLAAEFEAAWRRFLALDSLTLIPDTLESEWTRGRDRYLAFLIPINSPAVISYIRPVVERIGSIPGLEPFPVEYWHATIKGLGFLTEAGSAPDELSADDVRMIADSAGALFQGEPAFEMQIGPLSAFAEVVFTEVWDGGRIRELNMAMLDAMPHLLRYPIDGAVFLPHVSIARYSSDEGLAELKSVISELRQTMAPGPRFTVGAVDLIQARLSDSTPALEFLRRYDLVAA